MAGPTAPWRLGGLSVRELARRVARGVVADEVADRAAALSYYFVFALFPTLLFLTALFGFLPVPDLMGRLMAYAREVLPGDAAPMVERILGEITASRQGGLLSLGALAALWSASSGMASVMAALNVVHEVEDARPWWKRRLVAVLLTLAFSLFLVAALALMVFGPVLGAALASALELGRVVTLVWDVLGVPIAMLLALVGVGLVYGLAPAAPRSWRWVTPGSVLAVALWLVMSTALRLYVSRLGDYSATYGSIGGVILLLLWLYLTGFVLLVGAEVDAEIERAAAGRSRPSVEAAGGPVPVVAGGARSPREPERDAGTGRRPPGARRDAAGGRSRRPETELAGAALARWIAALRERGWAAPAGLLAGLVLAGLARRPRRDVAHTARRAVETGHEVTRALAAWERFQRRRRAA